MIVLRTRGTLLLFLFFILPTASAVAGTISGKVFDAISSEPLPGVRIAVVEKHTGAVSGFDGSFKLTLAPGDYKLKITYSGYLDSVLNLTVTDADQAINIGLQRNTGKNKEVTVNGKAENGSDASATVAVRLSDNVINAIAARSIEVSPDLDVADVSQRLSGVSMTRTAATGDAEYAIIRGMDKRYNYTTVNGIKIPSPDNEDRYVPLDIFPSELLDRLEVSKSLLPTMEGDAIGGSMNLVMKQAPDHEVASFQVGSGYDELFNSSRKFGSFPDDPLTQSPRVTYGAGSLAQITDFPASTWSPTYGNPSLPSYLSATFGNRFDDDRLGVIVAASYQNSYRGANTNFFYSTVNQVDNTPYLSEIENRQYNTQVTRGGGMANIDFRADENNTFQLFGMYASLHKNELRDTWDTNRSKGFSVYDVDVLSSIITTNETQGIGNLTLSGNDIIFGKDLQADWHLAYSNATLNSPDRADLELDGGYVKDSSGNVTIRTPNFTNSTREWDNSVDQDKSGYLTLKSTEDLFSTPVEFSYGGMYRNKQRTSSYDEYGIRVPPGVGGTQYYDGNISLDTLYVYNPQGSYGNPLNYTAYEDVSAGFIQAKFIVGNLTAIGGVRVEQTNFGWTSGDTLLSNGVGTISYTDMLPSVALKYSPVDNQNWRLSYYKSISRPNFFELVPNGVPGISGGAPGDDYTMWSNDSLNRTQADNIDLRWEYFPGGLDQLLAGVFYKHLVDPIEWTIVQSFSPYYQPNNLGDATNYGFELDFRKFFSNFGIEGNYTYTNSQITTPKTEYVNNTTTTVQETRPLEGQSNNIGNLSLLYKDFESGTSLQISGNYTGPAIVVVSTYYDNDRWSTGFVDLDFSGEQRLWGDLSVYVKVTNILNTPREEVIHQTYNSASYAPELISYQTNGQDVLVRREFYDRNYVLGFRFRM
jgi:outer membrane receptor protein involved in Fe transport